MNPQTANALSPLSPGPDPQPSGPVLELSSLLPPRTLPRLNTWHSSSPQDWSSVDLQTANTLSPLLPAPIRSPLSQSWSSVPCCHLEPCADSTRGIAHPHKTGPLWTLKQRTPSPPLLPAPICSPLDQSWRSVRRYHHHPRGDLTRGVSHQHKTGPVWTLKQRTPSPPLLPAPIRNPLDQS
jgi:hypothetical protein